MKGYLSWILVYFCLRALLEILFSCYFQLVLLFISDFIFSVSS